jgi:hypothetical protein
MVRLDKVPDNVKLRAGTTASVLVTTGTSIGGNGAPAAPVALQ